MGPVETEIAVKLQSELLSGESVLWAGRPNPDVIFHSDDWYMIPFSLLWGGFAIFWEAGVLGYWGHNSKGAPSMFMVIWGIPFVVIGQYVIWGRFFYDAWIKRRTYYAITNRRVLILQEGWKRKTSSTYLDSIPTIEREGSATGTLWFGAKYPNGRGARTKPEISADFTSEMCPSLRTSMTSTRCIAWLWISVKKAQDPLLRRSDKEPRRTNASAATQSRLASRSFSEG